MSGGPCILVASHMAKVDRIPLLMETLHSLIQQTYTTPIYLSISFEDNEIRDSFIQTVSENETINAFPYLWILMRRTKTPQMRHFALLFPEITEKNYEWIFFSDDDDIYDKDRVKVFMEAIELEKQHQQTQQEQEQRPIAGVYESSFGKEHREQRHEYWCYCLNIETLRRFYLAIHSYEDIVNHQCCDVLLGEYLRRMNDDQIFIRICEQYYHYRVENNEDSVTAKIQKSRSTWVPKPPSIGDPKFSEYIIELDDYLYENIELYFHDAYLRTLIGQSFDTILQYEFKEDYPLITYLDEVHIYKLKTFFLYIQKVCNELYDIKIE